MTIRAKRYHDFCFAHRVLGIDPKCANLHGHNARIYFTVERPETSAYATTQLDVVMEFGDIKNRLCQWLEDNWDHKTLLADDDPLTRKMIDAQVPGLVVMPFAPSSENLAGYLLNVIGPAQMRGSGCELVEVDFQETRKCSAIATLRQD